MSKKAVFIIFALLVGLTYLSFIQSKQKIGKSENQTRLFSFDTKQVKSLLISKGDEKVVINKKENIWLNESSFDYPANTSEIQKLFLALLDLKGDHKITSNPKNYERLGLSQKETLSIQLKGKSEQVLAQLDIGKSRTSTKPTYDENLGQYILPSSSGTTVYVTQKSLDFSSEPKDWLKKDFFSIPSNQINKISLLSSEEGKVSIQKVQKDKKESFQIIKKEDAHEEETWAIDNLVKQVQKMELDDLWTNESKEVQDLEFKTWLELESASKIYQFKGSESKGKHYLKIKVKALTEKEDGALKLEVEKENKQYEPWVYQIATWYGSQLQKTYKDFIKKPPAKAEEKIEEQQESALGKNKVSKKLHPKKVLTGKVEPIKIKSTPSKTDLATPVLPGTQSTKVSDNNTSDTKLNLPESPDSPSPKPELE